MYIFHSGFIAHIILMISNANFCVNSVLCKNNGTQPGTFCSHPIFTKNFWSRCDSFSLWVRQQLDMLCSEYLFPRSWAITALRGSVPSTSCLSVCPCNLPMTNPKLICWSSSSRRLPSSTQRREFLRWCCITASTSSSIQAGCAHIFQV